MLTLAQAKVGMADKVDQMVIDEFRRGSFLLENLIFDNAVSPGTGGSTLTYSYVRLKTPATATFRPLNTEYTPIVALREKKSVDLKIFGGSFSLDRVIINTAGAVDELAFQMSQAVEGARNLFHYTVINGDSVADENSFDGLDTFLTGSSTEYIPAATIDLSSTDMLDANHKKFADELNLFLRRLYGTPTMLLCNGELKARIESVGQRMGYYTQSEDAFGNPVDKYRGIPFIDLENYFDGTVSKPCVPITNGMTDLYAIQIARDGFHAVSPVGNSVITTSFPDMTEPGVMKKGDVEMVAAVALKNSLRAGVVRNIKVL